ncbi:MAG: alpha-hydroxy-acid oxidizing protein [Burkholderiales bacterium]|jgi:isopentenyl diphosphate isomerase/L-lactate dehydrogenase-like FMN-dependent dehydrogenase|nr:alpha-hydroxy-acid oxidizing protein [Burkholderiales bacterium]
MTEKTFGAYDIADLRELARRRLPKGVFEFFDRGNGDEVAVANNRAAFERIKLNPQMLVDTSGRSLATTLYGKSQTMPLVVGPTGSAGLAWYEGEIALARAAKAAGVPYTLATGSMTSLERVAAEAGGNLWFQVYMWPDRAASHALIARAKAAGYQALVVTVDTPVTPGREYNLRNGMTVPFRFTRRNVTDVLLHPRWLAGVLLKYLLTTGMPRYENYPVQMKSRITALPMGRSMMVTDSLTWDDLREIRKLWPHPLMVKGILRAGDAKLAADCGVDGVIVSNHGGRAVDSTRAPIEILPEVVAAVGNRATVIVDSGFRRGADVVKALALGAKAVMIGRATLYGTAVAGEAGAARALEIYRDEVDRLLALIGCPDISALDAGYLARSA